MTGRQSRAVEDAIAAVLAGSSVAKAAKAHGCHVRSLYRALRALKSPAPATAP